MTDLPANPNLRLLVPTVSARVSVESVASTLARLIASHAAVTRSDLVRVTGLARSTVTVGLEMLERAGVIRNLGVRTTLGRGRPAEELGLNPSFGLILVADLGANFGRLSVHDLGQQKLVDTEMWLHVADGPESVLATVIETFNAMLGQIDHPRPLPLVLVMGLPGPIDTSHGIAVKPPIMPGWDDYPVAETLAAEFGCPVRCENDVNLRALGEARALPADQSPLLYIKVSSGIGGGLVTASGELYHGADGSAGDIGHVRVHGADEVLCVCGNYGCIEAVASAPALLRQVREIAALDAKHDSKLPTTREELMAALRVNEKVTVGLVREAASKLGEVVANLVHFYNPARIVVGGGLTVPSGDMLAGIRAVVYRRALPLATRNLVISQPMLGEWSGTGGGLVVGIEHALTSDALGQAVARKDLRTEF
jgi:predicted NBD/HSP70 family sugar kinase